MQARWLFVVSFAIASLAPEAAPAAEEELVGVLALAVDPNVAEKINLSSEQMTDLLDLIDRRESEALERVMQVRDLPPDERRRAMSPFRTATEEKGLALLSTRQRELLEQIKLRRAGLSAAADEATAERLGLSDEQRRRIAELAEQRDVQLASATRAERPRLRGEFERRMLAVLDETQFAQWEAASGGSGEGRGGGPRRGGRGARSVENEANTPNTEQGPYLAHREEFPNDLASGDGQDSDDVENFADELRARTNDREPSTSPSAIADASAERLTFSFRHQPWEQVIQWFVDKNDLSLIMDAPPPGTFNYTDDREYSPAEALDLLNGVLQTKGFVLVRRHRLLMVVNLEDEIPPDLIPFVKAENLGDRGEYELVTTLFQLRRMTAEEAQLEVDKLRGPTGKIVVLPKSGQLLVTETAGRLRTMKEIIDAVENPGGEGEVRQVALPSGRGEQVLSVAKQLLGIPADAAESDDGSLRMAVEETGERVWLSGRADQVDRAVRVIESVKSGGGVDDSLQVEVFSVGTADTETVLSVVNSLTANDSTVKITADPNSGSIVAHARPSQMALIRATIEQMQSDAQKTVVIPLRVVDPQWAVLSINKLYNATGDDKSLNAPTVDGDLNNRKLIVRGTDAQITEIQQMLEQMGEGEDEDSNRLARGSIRVLPLTGSAARKTINQVRQLWPTVGSNPIRLVNPRTEGRGLTTRDAGGAAQRTPAPVRRRPEPEPLPTNEPPANEAAAPLETIGDDFTQIGAKASVIFAAMQTTSEDDETPEESVTESPSDADGLGVDALQELANTIPSESPILVMEGPNGITLVSDDLEALDAFEELIRTIATGMPAGGPEFAVYYLNHASAAVAAQTLAKVMGGDVGGDDNGVIGDLASAALGDLGGGLVGSMLGGGGSGGTTTYTFGGLMIVPDTRLNALIVQARPAELELMEQIIDVIDQPENPGDVPVQPSARLIPVFFMDATNVANVVKEVYSDRMVGAGGGNRGPSPEDFMRMLRGGRGGRDGGGDVEQEAAKMSIGVEARSNSLVVVAPDPLFQEVLALVEQIDVEDAGDRSTTRVVRTRRTSSEQLQKALASLVGPQAQMASNSSSSSSSNNQSNEEAERDRAREIQRRMEFFRRMREGGGGPPGFGRGGGPPGFGGRGGRGGRGGDDGGGRGGRGGGRG